MEIDLEQSFDSLLTLSHRFALQRFKSDLTHLTPAAQVCSTHRQNASGVADLELNSVAQVVSVSKGDNSVKSCGVGIHMYNTALIQKSAQGEVKRERHKIDSNF